jgi:hypothetical protein
MKYVVDIGALLECLDCVDSIKVNGEYYIAVPVIKEFINRFPKDKIESEYREITLSKEASHVPAE